MIRVKIFSVGKTKEEWLETALREYQKRMTGAVHIEYCWAKDDDNLTAICEKEKTLFALDPKGQTFSSEHFALFFEKNAQNGGSKISFVIGSAMGLPDSIKQKSALISLSNMTFTHQMSRLILVEQIYRAIEIGKKSNYHK